MEHAWLLDEEGVRLKAQGARRMLDSGCWINKAKGTRRKARVGCWILVTGCWMRVFRLRIVVFGFRVDRTEIPQSEILIHITLASMDLTKNQNLVTSVC